MQASDIPNLISVLRIFLSIPVVWLLLEGEFASAMVLFAVAGASDALDGFLAKRFGWESRLGGILDPLADKVLLVSSFLALGVLDLIPAWLVMLVIFRDLLIVTGAVIYHYRIESLIAKPSFISKVNTTVQILLVLAVVFDRGVWAFPPSLIVAMVQLTLVTTLLSGAAYVWTWSRRALRHPDRDNGGHRDNRE